jgi:putative protein-disulfide isomerase
MVTALTYVFDPLCGWCYGAGPALQALIDAGHAVTLMPSGLFVAPGRTMDPGFAAYAWTADQRIAALTGQQFSEAYRADVLGRADVPFNSGPATLALTAVWLEDSTREAEALAAIQRARYVDGLDICDPAVLGAILDRLGLRVAAARARAPDSALAAATGRRIASAQALMALHGLNGVPALLAGTERALPNGVLFGPREPLLAAVA